MKTIFQALEMLLLFFIFVLVYIYRDNISTFIIDNYINKKEAFVLKSNEYALDYDFFYVKKTDDFYAKDKQHLLDIFYTFLNSGNNEFYFYCDYENCESDVVFLTENNIIGNINNFVPPYNTYNNLFISINSWRKIDVIIDKAYSDSEIKTINSKLDEIIVEIIDDDMSDKEKIKVFHDYIVNSTKYDSEYIANNIDDVTSPSHRASGPLLYSKALCGGYSHVMSLFLNKIKIPNYRISSDTHIWNLVYIDNNWYHLDLTWDDPTREDNIDTLLHTYFLINTNKLKSLNTSHHNFDETIYKETNQETP